MDQTSSPLSDHRPDEEGIKTSWPGHASPPSRFQTTDLMKKGLRPEGAWILILPMLSDHRPDEEGIKTVSAESESTELYLSDHRPDEEGIKTAAACRMPRAAPFQTTDLMKKGLRLRDFADWRAAWHFRPQT